MTAEPAWAAEPVPLSAYSDGADPDAIALAAYEAIGAEPDLTRGRGMHSRAVTVGELARIKATTPNVYLHPIGPSDQWQIGQHVVDGVTVRSLFPLVEPGGSEHLRDLDGLCEAVDGHYLLTADLTVMPAAGWTPEPEPPPLSPWPEPEDRGRATLSDLGTVEYVDDLIRPGRITVPAAEEGTGKSFAISGELAIRVACAGGSFAGTWPVLRNGPVLVMSEMHPDDDFGREATVLGSLGLERAALTGQYYRLGLMTAANGRPALTVPEWREWVTGWMRERGVILLVVDTATSASQVDPWGKAIQDVYAGLRMMQDAYPELAIVLIVHLSKPKGRGERGISAVLGEWARWCDIVLLIENDGGSLDRVKLTARKRVRRERRIVATKAGGLLIDPVDADTTGPKVSASVVLAAVEARSGMTYAELGEAIGVSKDTASCYVKALGDRLDVVPGSARSGPNARARVYIAASPQIAAQAPAAMYAAIEEGRSPHAARTYIGAAVRAAMIDPPAVDDEYDPELAKDDDAEGLT